MLTKKGIIIGMTVAFGAAQALPGSALADLARDGADAAAKLITVTSSAGQFDGTELAVTNEITGVEYRAPMIERVRQGQIEPRGPYLTSSIFELE